MKTKTNICAGRTCGAITHPFSYPGRRLRSCSLVLALIGVASGGCAMTDSDIEGTQAAEIGSVTPKGSDIVLTVTSDVNDVVVSIFTTGFNTCPALETCTFGYDAGTALTIKTRPKNLAECEQFVRWDGACAGQGATCSLVINSSISTSAVFGPIAGCILN